MASGNLENIRPATTESNMVMHYVGALIGGLIATGVLTFLLSWLLRWVVKAPVGRLIAANALSLAIATSVAAFSLADG
ncbi:MAG TPA: hypothetical protein VFE11_10335, partial [Dongiaceae bacterium]|nr:hypothetical protein [Dongiaceae bacterium]